MPSQSDLGSDAFWEATGPFIFSEESWEKATGDVDALLELVDLPDDAAILDVACGPGRFALELARRGHRVTGVDATETYLAELRERAGAEDLPVETVHADMYGFRREETFDAAINVYSSFGYAATLDEERRMLGDLRASLRSGGVLVLEMASKEALARDFRPRSWQELDDGTVLLEEREVTDGWARMENRWTVVEPDGTRHDFTIRHRIFSGAELRLLLRNAGFAQVEIHGDLAGSPYDRQATRLVAVARRT